MLNRKPTYGFFDKNPLREYHWKRSRNIRKKSMKTEKTIRAQGGWKITTPGMKALLSRAPGPKKKLYQRKNRSSPIATPKPKLEKRQKREKRGMSLVHKGRRLVC